MKPLHTLAYYPSSRTQRVLTALETKTGIPRKSLVEKTLKDCLADMPVPMKKTESKMV